MWPIYLGKLPLFVVAASSNTHQSGARSRGTSAPRARSSQREIDLRCRNPAKAMAQAGSHGTYHVVVWGSTGLVGRLVSRHIAQHYQVPPSHLDVHDQRGERF